MTPIFASPKVIQCSLLYCMSKVGYILGFLLFLTRLQSLTITVTIELQIYNSLEWQLQSQLKLFTITSKNLYNCNFSYNYNYINYDFGDPQFLLLKITNINNYNLYTPGVTTKFVYWQIRLLGSVFYLLQCISLNLRLIKRLHSKKRKRIIFCSSDLSRFCHNNADLSRNYNYCKQ
jgi:hypothetical protein